MFLTIQVKSLPLKLLKNQVFCNAAYLCEEFLNKAIFTVLAARQIIAFHKQTVILCTYRYLGT